MLKENVSPLFKYLYYSILVTILDVAIVWALFRCLHVNVVVSNTVGVVAGFLVHYLLASKSVFNSDYGLAGFTIYLSTFLFGLALADGLIFVGEKYLFVSMPFDTDFILSKGLSIVVPFFILFYLRKYLYRVFKISSSEGVNYGRN